jgi:cell envelope opacity-associated protein A
MPRLPLLRLGAALALIACVGCGRADNDLVVATASGSAEDDSSNPVVATGEGTSWQDARLTALVTEQLVLDPWIDATQVGVTVSDGVVNLRYSDLDAPTAERARQVAALVPGVARVDAPAASAPGSGESPEPDAEAAPVELREPADALVDVVALGTPRASAAPAVDAAQAAPANAAPTADPGAPAAVAPAVATTDVARAASGDRPRTYRVRAGETLSLVARRTMGDGNAWPRIYELNRSIIGPNPEAIAEGMELRIPQD